MSTHALAGIVFGFVAAGGILGIVLRATLPNNHLHDESRDLIKTAAGLIATLVALVIGLLVSGAKQTFDSTAGDIAQVGVKVIALDRVLMSYGPEAKGIRDLLRGHVEASIEQLSGAATAENADDAAFEIARNLEEVREKIRALTPQGDTQRALQTQAVQLTDDAFTALLLLLEQSQNDLPTLFLVVLIAWLAILFASFGILAPANATAYVSLLVCAISISCAMFLILELNRPLAGAVQVSTTPLQKAAKIMRR